MIKTIQDLIELKIVNPIYKVVLQPVKDNRGRFVRDDLKRIIKEEKQKFVKDLLIPHHFLKEGITSYGKTITSKNELAKKRSIVYDKYSARYYTVAHTTEEIHEALYKDEERVKIGFLAHTHKGTRSKY